MKKIILGVLFFISCLFANEIKFDMNFTKDTSCEIRKIKLYQNPIWASKIEFKNGKNAFFCSPKSMFEFYFNEEKWNADIHIIIRIRLLHIIFLIYSSL